MVRTLPSNAGGMDSIPGWGTQIPHALWFGRKGAGGPESVGWRLCVERGDMIDSCLLLAPSSVPEAKGGPGS